MARTTHEQALWLKNQLGFSVIPLDHPEAPSAKEKKSQGKTPVVKWERFKTAPPTDKELSRWFTLATPRNIGIVTGALSGIVVVDADSPSAVLWVEAHLPSTPLRVRTSRGEHFYYRHPGGTVRNQTAATSQDGAKPGIDIRGDGGYAVAPGGLHFSRARYAEVTPWPNTVDGVPLYSVDWFPTGVRAHSPPNGGTKSRVGRILHDGERTGALASMAGTMRRAGFDADAIEAALLRHNSEWCEPPLPELKVRGIAASIGKYPPGENNQEGRETGRPRTRQEREDDEFERLLAQRQARRRLDADERGATVTPEMVTLSERLSRPRVEVPYRIAGWQPSGSRVLLSAQYKSGKTTLVGNLLRSLVDGDPFLGRDAVTPVEGTVALIDTEMGSQLDIWLDGQAIKNTHRVIVSSLRGRVGSFDLLSREIRSEWASRLRAAHVSYLVLDCLRPVLDSLGLDEHKDAGRFLVAFDELLAEAGLTDALIVHHMGHTNERARGDSRLRDWPDVEWRLVRQGDDPAAPRYITAYGRDVEVSESTLSFESHGRRLTIGVGSRKDTNSEAALADILALLGNKEMSGRKIETAMDKKHSRISVRAAIVLGVRTKQIVTTRGKHGAFLHRRASSAPGRRSAPGPRQRTASECASAYRARRTRDQSEEPQNEPPPAI